MKTAKPTTDMVCYHMQQCVEKCLKAYLVAHEKPFRRTHDIAELIEYCKEIDPKETSIEIALFTHEFVRAKLF